MTGMEQLLSIWHCCRDWPVAPVARVGRCGECGKRPTPTDKTVAQYMAEREQKEDMK